ncbi:hypothetical protein [Cupriavidus gilardii]|uniref:Uncharacterized protein n=1 Tax=Cupriavidus gilardii TaxID=82541 RepID=A0A849BC44_9BURK|nr:hypothetical protein [Cupriavidus gilardii]KAB0594217.1 hypothetical protein F7Q96_22605 [Cupriavidus gilardii]NNH12962.1 hypothetical protein [Cupriavidus gilardii]
MKTRSIALAVAMIVPGMPWRDAHAATWPRLGVRLAIPDVCVISSTEGTLPQVSCALNTAFRIDSISQTPPSRRHDEPMAEAQDFSLLEIEF